MIPIRIHETEREGFEDPVVELWRDDEFVGMVFHDGEVVVVQIYPTDDGDVHDLDLDDLVRALELARAIVDPEFLAEDVAEGWEETHPAVVELLAEFDPLAAYRSDDGEGYFTGDVAGSFVARCRELGIAVVEMDGLEIDAGEIRAVPDLTLDLGGLDVDHDTLVRRSTATAAERLAAWPPEAFVAFVVRGPDGEDVVA
ncbi:MAG TPA: hypothetical protein ENK55_10510 [Actinobacteria bacterium]|nr:hypothetical protein [Actinomycetota bacterium]